MKFIVEDGTGLSLANSYCSVAFADEFCEDNGITSWGTPGSLSVSEVLLKKQQSLVAASRWVTVTYTWRGHRMYNFQALAFPRIIDSVPSVYPIEIRQAAVLAAVRIYSGEVLAPDLKQGGYRKMVKAGPVTVEYGDNASPYTVYQEIDDLVAPWSYSGSGGGRGLTVEIRK